MKHLLSLTLSSLLLAATFTFVSAHPGDKPAKAKAKAAAAATDTTHTKRAKAAKAVKPVTAQCAAMTKKGTQCTRKAVAGSKYCKQHANYKPKS